MSPTIKDVAEKAGVSLSTVSLVLNQKKNVAKATVEKVEKAIDELNYHPRHSARGLASKRSGNIGFILTNDHFSHAEPFYTKIFLGSEFEARNYNYYILLTTIENSFNKKDIPRFLLEKNVDGVILAGKVPDNLVNLISKYTLPLIFIDYFPGRGRYPSVLIDNIDGAEQAVGYLLKQGHEKIAFIGGDIAHPSILDRFTGYKQTLEKHGMSINEKLAIADMSYTADRNGYDATMRLLAANEPFTAVFAANDAMAYGCMRCLKEHNISIPDQVAIIGFDDVDVAIQMDPQLTTLRVDKEEMGAIAVKNMVDMIYRNKISIGKILVPTELVIRKSA